MYKNNRKFASIVELFGVDDSVNRGPATRTASSRLPSPPWPQLAPSSSSSSSFSYSASYAYLKTIVSSRRLIFFVFVRSDNVVDDNAEANPKQ